MGNNNNNTDNAFYEKKAFLLSLRPYDLISIKGDIYKVQGIVTYRENAWSWKEYKLTRNNDVLWLSIEDDDEFVVSMSKEIPAFTQSPEEQIGYDGIPFYLQSRGCAKVEDYVGNLNMSIGDEVNYFEYSDLKGTEFLSMEFWDGELEMSLGYKLDVSEIAPVKKQKNNNSYGSNKKSKKSFLFIAIVVLIILLFAANFRTTNVSKVISKDPKFEYTTSITNSSSNTLKANVYKSQYSVPETARHLIQKAKPEDHSSLDNEENISLLYKDKYVFIYAGEDGETYVQESSREYAYRGSSSVYRSRHRNSSNFFRDYYFYRAFTRDIDRYSGRSYYNKSYSPSNTKDSFYTYTPDSKNSYNSYNGSTSGTTNTKNTKPTNSTDTTKQSQSTNKTTTKDTKQLPPPSKTTTKDSKQSQSTNKTTTKDTKQLPPPSKKTTTDTKKSQSTNKATNSTTKQLPPPKKSTNSSTEQLPPPSKSSTSKSSSSYSGSSSVRRGSTSSRKSIGGGTSFGK